MPNFHVDLCCFLIVQGIDSMSDYAIAFHYVKPGMMYLLEYALYHLRPYGIHLADKELNVNETGTILSR